MKNRKCVVIASAALACIFLVGGVFAVTRDNSIFSNILGFSSYKTVATEVFSSPKSWQTCESIPKIITVKNESTDPVVARIKYTEEWVASDKTTQLDVVDSTTNLRMAIVDRDNVDKWLLKDDGYYYYYQPLEPGETTLSFMKSVTLNCDANLAGDAVSTCTKVNGRTVCDSNVSAYADATYTLRATLSTMQANGAKNEWNYAPVSNTATLLKGSSVTSRIGSATNIVRVDQLPDNFPDENDYRRNNDVMNAGLRASTESSEKAVYMWDDAQYHSWGGEIDENKYQDNTIYWFSEATKIYYNPDMSAFLADSSGGKQLTDMSFYSQFDTSRIVNLEAAFWFNTSNDFSWLSGWDVSNVESMKNTFAGSGLTNLSTLEGWNVSKVNDFSGMFQYNLNLTSAAAIKNWNVKDGANLEGMFTGSSSVTDLSELSWLQ